MFLDDGASSISTFLSSVGLAEHTKSLMGNVAKSTSVLTIRIGNDAFGAGSVRLAGVSFCATALAMDSRLFEASSVNESTAFPTTDAPMGCSRSGDHEDTGL